MKTTNKLHYVYKITNLKPTDERLYYIGVKSSHDPLNDNYMGTSKYLDASMKEIGKENFKKEVLSIWDTRKLAVDEEIRLHEEFDVAINELFYNKSKQKSNGFDTTGVKNNITPEVRAKQVASRILNGNSNHSEETKKKIGLANKGKVRKPISNTTRSKLIKNNPMHKLENRLKVSESLMGHKVSDSTKKKIGLANKGKVRTSKIKELMSIKSKNKNNPNAKIFILVNPDGTEILTYGNLREQCKKFGLNSDTMSLIARGKRKIITDTTSKMFGWNAILCNRVKF